ncbi:MAG TPA: sodium:solute symporter family protein [Cyclobacteriaceae bacterium]|nr:sodium:solute symporter family protein [Cyclobacteriaceae bacterium]
MTLSLHPSDWIIIIVFLIASFVIGLIARKKIASIDDFLLLGRKLGVLKGIATLSSTEMGLVTIIYFAEEAYSNGFVALTAGVIAAFTMWLVGRTGFVIGHLRNLNIRTVPEYFQIRFHPGVRWIAGVASFLTGVLNMGIFLQVESRFMAVIMGLSDERLPLIMGIILLIVLVYTILGGMYTVVITDIIQFFLIIIGIIIVSYYSISGAGGFSGMIDAVRENYGNAGFDLRYAPHYGLLFLIWTTLYYISGWSSWQPVAQRTLSMKDTRTARTLFRYSSIFMFFRACFPMLWGIAALAIVGTLPQSQSALPSMLVKVIPSGMFGIMIIGFMAASMSTYSSYLLSFSAILVQDVIAPAVPAISSDKRRTFAIRADILLIGLFMYFWGLYYEFSDTVFRYITLTGSLAYAGMLTGLVGGIYWKRASTGGAYMAFIASAIPPLIGLAMPGLSATTAGLLSFILAPVSLVIGSFIFLSEKK